MRSIASLMVAAGLMAASALWSESEGLSLTGRVVDGVGNPMPDVDLFLLTADWNIVAGPVSPDENGKFSFTRLAPGSYILTADRADFGSINYGQLPDSKVRMIAVTAGEKQGPVVFRIQARGSISGTVLDEAGEPMAHESVIASRAIWHDAGLSYTTMEADSDDQGHYRITNVPAGSYIVCAQPRGGPRAVPAAGALDFSASRVDRFYGQDCRPEKNARPSSMLQMSAGQKLAVDFTLPSEPRSSIRVRVVGDPSPTLELRVRHKTAGNDNGALQPTRDSDYDFHFPRVPPGDYVLTASGRQRNPDGTEQASVARMPISVTGDITEVELLLQPAATMEVAFHSPPGTALASNVAVLNLLPAGEDLPIIESQKRTDGVLYFDALAAGRYWLQTRTLKTTCIVGASVGGKNVLHRVMRIAEGSRTRLDLTLSEQCAEIQGKVRSPMQPFPTTRLVAMLSGTPEEPGDTWTDILTEDEFSLGLLPAGRYLLWAWPEEDSGPFLGPESLKAAAKYATVLDIKEGEPLQVEIPLLGLNGEFK